MLISLIVPVYNVNQYLKECIDSIINQTYSNLEIILINDGSTDNCGAICNEYALLDERIKLIHKPNGGLSDARNAGLDVVSGEYVTFIDSDDFVHPNFIEVLYRNLIETDSDISLCKYFKFQDGDNNEFDELFNCSRSVYTGLYMLENLNNLSMYPNNVVSWGKLYKSTIFNELRFPVGRVHEDEYLIHHIYSKVRNVCYIDIKLYYYRVRVNSIMQMKISKQRILDSLYAIDDRLIFMKDNGMNYLISETKKARAKILLNYFYKSNQSSFVRNLIFKNIENLYYINNFCLTTTKERVFFYFKLAFNNKL